MTDLSTRYLGLDLRSPIVASGVAAHRRARDGDAVEDAGASADRHAVALRGGDPPRGDRAQPGAGGRHRALRRGARLLPDVDDFANVSDRYLALIESLKAQSSVPVIASLNATTTGGWARYAALIEQAGADALELNLYHVAADPERTAADIEAADLDVVRGRARRIAHPARGEAQPVLLVDGELRPRPSSTPAPMGSCCSTASTNPTSISRRSTWSTGSS